MGLVDGAFEFDAGLLQPLGQIGRDGARLRSNEIGLLKGLADARFKLLPCCRHLCAQIAFERARTLLEGLVFLARLSDERADLSSGLFERLLGVVGEGAEIVANGLRLQR